MIPTLDRDFSSGSVANRQAIAGQFVVDWLRAASRSAVNREFGYAASIAAGWLEHSPGLAAAREIVGIDCEPWFDGSAFGP